MQIKPLRRMESETQQEIPCHGLVPRVSMERAFVKRRQGRVKNELMRIVLILFLQEGLLVISVSLASVLEKSDGN